MKTSGVFFLRGAPASVRMQRPDGSLGQGWMLLLGERGSERGITVFSALWAADGADAFFRRNSSLKAGDCLSLTLERLHVRDNEICGHVAACELAPPRWPQRATALAGRPAPCPLPSLSSSPIAPRDAAARIA